MRYLRGFTLIELLVVIAVIAVLMGILMPALQKAKEQAQSAVCKSQLKGYALAVAMYAQDNDDRFTDSRKTYFTTYETLPGETGTLHQRWCNGEVNLNRHPEFGSEFFKYLAEAKALICPTFKRIAKAQGSKISNTAQWDEGNEAVNFFEPWMNYTQNAYLGPNRIVSKTMQVKDPATVASFADEGPYREEGINTQGLNDTALWPVWDEKAAQNIIKRVGSKRNVKPGISGLTTFFDVVAGFHNAPSGSLTAGKGNVAFIDGHIDAVNRMDTFAITWPER